MDQRQGQRAEVDSNYQTFLSDLPQLIRNARGHFAVYRHQRLVEIFPSFAAAFVYGNQEYQDRIFSVQEIADEPLDLGGLPYASDSGDVRSERS